MLIRLLSKYLVPLIVVLMVVAFSYKAGYNVSEISCQNSTIAFKQEVEKQVAELEEKLTTTANQLVLRTNQIQTLRQQQVQQAQNLKEPEISEDLFNLVNSAIEEANK